MYRTLREVRKGFDNIMCSPLLLNSHTAVTEMASVQHRNVVALFVPLSIATSLITSGALAYWLRDWRSLTWGLCACAFVAAPIGVILPESARWQLAQRNRHNAYRTLSKGARINGTLATFEQALREELMESRTAADKPKGETPHWQVRRTHGGPTDLDFSEILEFVF